MFAAASVFILCSIAMFVLYVKVKLCYFDSTCIKTISSGSYLVSLFKYIVGTRSINEHCNAISHPFTDQAYVGSFEIISPVVILRHPSTIRLVCVEKFDHFVNHKSVLDEDLDPLFGRMIFCMTDQKWRAMRSDLTPAFSSSKTKHVFNTTKRCSEKIMNFYKEKCIRNEMIGGGQFVELEAQEATLKYTMSFLAYSVFGDDSDALMSEIYANTNRCVAFGGIGLMKFALLRFLPKFLRISSIQISPPDMVTYFQNALISSIQWRSEQNVNIPDFVQMMGEAKKDWTLNEKTAQLLQQSLTYVSTVPTQTSNALHELVCNPHMLRRLQEEVDKTNEETDGNLTYESLNQMEYLDMVVCETIRKWPVASLTDRVCTSDCDLGPVSENSSESYVIKKGQVIIIPITSIQNDPMFWDDPENFDPERFSKENKHKIKPLTYIPFGVGPRNCIAQRQILLHIKIMLYQILLNFNIKAGRNMDSKLHYREHTLVTSIKGGTWLVMEPRK